MQRTWWRGAVIYQIYPRSFFDSNNDGIGDLPGIIAKMAYLAKLGVDAIWISPFLQSPQCDFGYDVSDYFSIDPLFGTHEDYLNLLQLAHEHGLKVIMDLVLNHTSDQHAWFMKSSRDQTNAKADWYVWADAKPDGSVPNNWLSVFGGSAWQWHAGRQQYYLHHFLASQPDLNFHQPQVLQAVLGVMEYWLQQGVDGFRLDTANYYIHDAKLRDNPLRAAHEPPAEGVPPDHPYARQHHLYDKTQPENLLVLNAFRQLLDRYPGCMSIGEVGDDHSLQTAAAYVCGNEYLHMVYTFRLLDASDQFCAQFVHDTIKEQEVLLTNDGWPCWALNNHDVSRMATRLAHGDPSLDYNRILMALSLCLRGTICLYQGEELGLPQAEVPLAHMRDPYGIKFYPVFKGRDGCRTPMPWQQKDGGFSTVEPWLPISATHLLLAVDLQEAAPQSLLNHYRQFLCWRKQHNVLLLGAIKLYPVVGNVLVFERYTVEERLLIALNLGDKPTAIPYLQAKGPDQLCNMMAAEADCFQRLPGHGFADFEWQSPLVLPGFGVLFVSAV